MESNHCESGACKTTRGTSKSSRPISKLRVATPITHQSHNRSGNIRIVHIVPAEIIRTDPAQFRALVQKLTGRHSAHSSIKFKHKKLNLPVIPESTALDQSTAQLQAHRHQNPIDGFSKQLGKSKFMAPLPEIKPDPLDEGRVRLCHDLSGFFGGFEELDIFSSLLDSTFKTT